ncbi:amidohydrolase family protein [Candidatus Kaiserbacteria bacterium]|nr:amidohydrolase family protein [Candidatus Kaiserbacteria bacterium]
MSIYRRSAYVLGGLLVVAVILGGVHLWRRMDAQAIRRMSAYASFVIGQVWDTRVSAALGKPLEETNCPPPPERHPYRSSYLGPMVDTHVHMAPIPDGPVASDELRPTLGVNLTIADYVCMMDTEGTSKAFTFFPVWEPIISESVDVVDKTMERYPDRFVPFLMPPDRDDRPDGFPTVTADILSNMLKVVPGLFKGYGEIGLYARGDHGGPTGAPELPPDSSRLLAIYPVVRKDKLLVYFHLGQGQQESFEKVLSANPDINFIWHGDQLIPYGEGGKQNLSHIAEILERHPNAYYGVDELYGDVWLLRHDIPKEKFFTHLEKYEPLLKKDLATWKDFIEAHPDQVLWGTDRGGSALWSLDLDVAIALNDYTRAFIGRLDPSVQEKYAHKNAERLIGTSEEE